jgi:hypothetical protein
MSDFLKAKVVVSAVYKNGDVLKQNHNVPARVAVFNIPGADKFKELSLRLVVDAGIAEELLEGLVHGNVSLDIEEMLSAAERESKS